jgi:hypothetical protein
VAHVCGVCGAGYPLGSSDVDDPLVDRMSIPQFLLCSLLGAFLWYLLAILVFAL